jgi:hypothetical protein
MKRPLICLLSAFVGAVVLISCGGGGVRTALSQTSREVQKMQWQSLLSMSNSGLQLPFFFGGGGGTSGTTGGGGGAGFSFPSMGGFIRHFGGGGGFAARVIEGTRGGGTSGTTGGTNGGGGGEPQFYFDEWLQLWVDVSFTETTFTCLFYQDEAKTQPAGFSSSTFTGDWNTYPQSYTSNYSYTAGTFAGAHGTYECTQESEFVGHMNYENTYSDSATDEGQSSWNETESTWSSEWHSANNASWYLDSGTWRADGTMDYQCSNSEGWSTTWHYNADWSGSAHFEGPNPLLPADMTWTSSGHYRIVYANGLVEEWDWDDIWGSGGTSGSTSAGGTVTVTGGTSSSTGALTTGSTGAATNTDG